MGPRGGRVVSDQAFLQKHDRFEYCCPHAADHNNQTGVKRHRLWWVFLEVCSNVKTAETVSVGTSSCCAALVMIFWVVFFSGLKSKIRYSGFSYSPKSYCTTGQLDPLTSMCEWWFVSTVYMTMWEAGTVTKPNDFWASLQLIPAPPTPQWLWK